MKHLQGIHWIITTNSKINVWKCKLIFPTETLQQKIEITDLKPFLAGENTSVLIILATTVYMSDLCVCVLCSRLLFPYMVSFLSSFHVIELILFQVCVIMCLLSGVFKSCLLSSIWSGLLVIPGVSVGLPYLDVVIKDYYFEVYPRLRVPRFSCCVHRDNIL